MRLLAVVVVLLAGCGGGAPSSQNDLAVAGADFAVAGADLAVVDLLSDDALSGPAAGCVQSGGSVTTSLCCASVTAFPNTCAVGACSCAPASSHMISSCACPSGKCFDGAMCH